MFLSWAPTHINEDENFEKKKFPLDELKTDLKPFVVRYGAFAIREHNGEEMELLTFLSSHRGKNSNRDNEVALTPKRLLQEGEVETFSDKIFLALADLSRPVYNSKNSSSSFENRIFKIIHNNCCSFNGIVNSISWLCSR